MHIAEVLRDLTCQLQALLRIIAGRHRLSLTQAQVLFSLPTDGLPLSSLAHRLGRDASTISRIVDKMAQQGWVRRMPSPEDRRINRVVLTAAGRQLYQRLAAALEVEVRELMTGLDAARQEDLSQHLEELTWRLMRHRP